MTSQWLENIELLWKVIDDYIHGNNISFDNNEKDQIRNQFNRITNQYYEFRYHTHKYKTINKEILQKIHSIISEAQKKKEQHNMTTHFETQNQSSQSTENNSTNKDNQIITNEELRKEREKLFNNDFERIKEDFNQYNIKPETKTIKFEDDVDEPSSNMDDLLKKELESRKYDEQQFDNINNTHTSESPIPPEFKTEDEYREHQLKLIREQFDSDEKFEAYLEYMLRQEFESDEQFEAYKQFVALQEISKNNNDHSSQYNLLLENYDHSSNKIQNLNTNTNTNPLLNVDNIKMYNTSYINDSKILTILKELQEKVIELDNHIKLLDKKVNNITEG